MDEIESDEEMLQTRCGDEDYAHDYEQEETPSQKGPDGQGSDHQEDED